MHNAQFNKGHTAQQRAERSDLTVYCRHVEDGISIRALAREYGTHPSTIMRQVRRVESRRDDPLFDQAVDGIHRDGDGTAVIPALNAEQDREFRSAARLVLMALNKGDACLAVVPTLEIAVVVSTDATSRQQPVNVKRVLAERMAVNDWIKPTIKARVIRYEITLAGRQALRRMLAEEESARAAGDEMNPYGDQHRDMRDGERSDGGRKRFVRYNGAESPVSLLAKHKDADGKPFLSADLVSAAERLREDFELAQMGPRVAQDWDRFLTPGGRGQFRGDRAVSGSAGARDRVGEALKTLGPGLGDVVLRVCCFLEGMENAEKRFGWSARSGKVVLKIALVRLAAFYQALGHSQMIG